MPFGFGDFVPVFQRVTKVKQTNVDAGEENECASAGNEASDLSDQTSPDSSTCEDPTEGFVQKIFSCPEEGCTKSFVRYSSMEKPQRNTAILALM